MLTTAGSCGVVQLVKINYTFIGLSLLDYHPYVHLCFKKVELKIYHLQIFVDLFSIN